jgi:hypothetical protein
VKAECAFKNRKYTYCVLKARNGLRIYLLSLLMTCINFMYCYNGFPCYWHYIFGDFLSDVSSLTAIGVMKCEGNDRLTYI